MRKKLLTVALAATMAVSSVFSAFAEDVDASKKYDGGQKIDGSSAWNTADGDNYLISETPVTVKFTNTPFLRKDDAGADQNWFNFVFETVASDTVKGITMRADAYAWTYGDASSEPTYVAEKSWGDVWDDFMQMCKDNAEVSITAKKADANNVTFDIAFGSAATEKYTVTYPDGVPSDLRFHVGADGGSIVVNEVVYGSGSTENVTPAPSTTDETTAASATPAAGSKDNDVTPSKTGDTSAVAVVAIVALGAAVAVVASKKKVTE